MLRFYVNLQDAVVLSVDVASGVFEAEVSLTLTWQDERLRDKSLNSCAAYWPFVEASAAADAQESLVWDVFEALDGPRFFNALSVTSLDLGAGGASGGGGGGGGGGASARGRGIRRFDSLNARVSSTKRFRGHFSCSGAGDRDSREWGGLSRSGGEGGRLEVLWR